MGPFRRSAAIAFTCAFAFGLGGRPAAAETAFDRLVAMWSNLHDYTVMIHAHEVLGTDSDEHEIYYAFRKSPQNARLDVVEGTKSGATIVWSSGDGVTAYHRALSFLKLHGGTKDRNLTSLRGNGILMPNIGDLIRCFSPHRDALTERVGPILQGDATDEISLPYAGVSCADDSETDARTVTLDVIDVSRRTGLILERTRFAGDEVIERWTMRDYKLDSGLSDDALR